MYTISFFSNIIFTRGSASHVGHVRRELRQRTSHVTRRFSLGNRIHARFLRLCGACQGRVVGRDSFHGRRRTSTGGVSRLSRRRTMTHVRTKFRHGTRTVISDCGHLRIRGGCRKLFSGVLASGRVLGVFTPRHSPHFKNPKVRHKKGHNNNVRQKNKFPSNNNFGSVPR